MSRPAMWTASTRVYHFYDAFGHVIGSEECEEGKLDTKYGILLLHPARDGRLYPAPCLARGNL